jgi:hypothetical protein
MRGREPVLLHGVLAGARDGRRPRRDRGVAAADGVLAEGVAPHGGALRGLAAAHRVEVAFDPARVATTGRLHLLLSGWFEWVDATALLAAARTPGVALRAPEVEVSDGRGGWRAVAGAVGFPAGPGKTALLDLTGALYRGDPRVRVTTTLAIRWDAVRLGVEASEVPRVTPLPLSSARLWRRGFSAGTPRLLEPRIEDLDFHRLDLARACDPLPGTYTAYGDVRALLLGGDDRVVAMASGDALARLRRAGTAALPGPRARLPRPRCGMDARRRPQRPGRRGRGRPPHRGLLRYPTSAANATLAGGALRRRASQALAPPSLRADARSRSLRSEGEGELHVGERDVVRQAGVANEVVANVRVARLEFTWRPIAASPGPPRWRRRASLPPGHGPARRTLRPLLARQNRWRSARSVSRGPASP